MLGRGSIDFVHQSDWIVCARGVGGWIVLLRLCSRSNSWIVISLSAISGARSWLNDGRLIGTKRTGCGHGAWSSYVQAAVRENRERMQHTQAAPLSAVRERVQKLPAPTTRRGPTNELDGRCSSCTQVLELLQRQNSAVTLTTFLAFSISWSFFLSDLGSLSARVHSTHCLFTSSSFYALSHGLCRGSGFRSTAVRPHPTAPGA